jgi:hypothetical protein
MLRSAISSRCTARSMSLTCQERKCSGVSSSHRPPNRFTARWQDTPTNLQCCNRKLGALNGVVDLALGSRSAARSSRDALRCGGRRSTRNRLRLWRGGRRRWGWLLLLVALERSVAVLVACVLRAPVRLHRVRVGRQVAIEAADRARERRKRRRGRATGRVFHVHGYVWCRGRRSRGGRRCGRRCKR